MLFLLSILFSFQLHAHNPLPVKAMDTVEYAGPEIVLNLKTPLVSGNSVKLGYQIPYPGYIEFHLFGPDGTKIWQNFGVQEKGEHYQAIRRDKLEAGATYTYEFWYKGKPYPGKFTN